MNISTETINKVLHVALDKGIDFAELYAEKNTSGSISLEDNKIEKIRSGIDQGTGIRLIHDNITYYGYINSFTEKDLLNLAKELSLAVKTKKIIKSPLNINSQPQKNYSKDDLPDKTPIEKKVEFVISANETARKYDSRITQVSVSYAESSQNILIANSEGLNIRGERVRTRFVTQVVAAEKNIIETGYESAAAAKGISLLQEFTPENIAQIAARRAILCLEAQPAPAGQMPVVLAGSAGGTMVHEACGHALEADFIHKKTSIFSEKLNKKVVSDLITVIDDSSIPGYYGTNNFDDEGTVTKKNILIEKGVLTGFMTDRLNAKLLNIPLSGNGRRQSYRFAPIPRMTNTYIQTGNSTYENILSSVKNGILVKKMGGGQVDITNGNFVFEISEGYLIKNGKQDAPIRGATLVGNGIEVLASVDQVGNDLHFIPGTCGKGQHAPVTDGQPTLHIPQLIIGGHQ